MKFFNNEKIVNILWKSLKEEVLAAEEQETLDQWLFESVYNRNVFAEVTDKERVNKELKILLSWDSQPVWENILRRIKREETADVVEEVPEISVPEVEEIMHPEIMETRTVKMPWFRKIAAAAAVIIAVSLVVYFSLSRGPKEELAKINPVVNTVTSDDPYSYIHPASDHAHLKLADGREFDLNREQGDISYNNGKNSFQNKWKNKESVVKFSAVHDPSNDQSFLTFNTLSTPRGGRYRAVLPDGSHVWLNAASTLRFPSSFNSKKRVVYLTGEAYFEVSPVSLSSDGTKDKVPFYVIREDVENVEVEVVGTHFNIKAYADEPEIAATLLEGSVKISKGSQACKLNPGEQARINYNEESIRRSRVDPEEAVVWKNDFFSLQNRTAEEIVKEVARWYNLDVQLPAVKSTKTYYGGAMKGNEKIINTINSLASINIYVKIQGNKLILLP